MEAPYENTIINGQASYNETEAREPMELWAVVDKNGSVAIAKDGQHARAKATCYDAEYPSLGPHRAARFVEQAS